MMKQFLTAVLLASAVSFAFSANAQDSHAGHDHGADGHSHAKPPSMSPEEIAKVSHIYSQSPEDHVVGQADAPNTLIVYASVTCPHCGDWFTNDYPILQKELIEKGKMKMVFREFPTGPVEVSMAGFQLANCAGADKYFDVLQFQMENQEDTFAALKEGKAIERFLEIAAIADIKGQEAMFTCFDNEDGFERVEQSMTRARAANLTGVPALILNGDVVEGPSDAASIKALLP